jgi:2'-5' RNA ligase
MTERILRTFIAVTVPRQVLAVRDMLATTIEVKRSRIRWVKNGQIHLTLKFLGHTPETTVDRVNQVLAEIVTRHQIMEYVISGTGCFPVPSRPRVLWLGMEGDFGPLNALVKDIHRELEPLGFPVEEKPFVPHITIARIKYPPKTTPDVTRFLNTHYEPITLQVNRLRYMSSELFPNGPVYSILGTHFLAPQANLQAEGNDSND